MPRVAELCVHCQRSETTEQNTDERLAIRARGADSSTEAAISVSQEEEWDDVARQNEEPSNVDAVVALCLQDVVNIWDGLGVHAPPNEYVPELRVTTLVWTCCTVTVNNST